MPLVLFCTQICEVKSFSRHLWAQHCYERRRGWTDVKPPPTTPAGAARVPEPSWRHGVAVPPRASVQPRGYRQRGHFQDRIPGRAWWVLMHERMNKRMNARINECMDDWMNVTINQSRKQVINQAINQLYTFNQSINCYIGCPFNWLSGWLIDWWNKCNVFFIFSHFQLTENIDLVPV